MSILRTSKFVRYIGNIARNIVLSNSRDGILVKRQSFAFTQNFGTATAVSQPQTENTIDRSIKRLDEDARRVGRISRRELEEVIEEIKSARSATTSQSLMLIRCCGNLVPDETPEFRTKLVSNVWEILQKLGIPMDISHYNALLRVYLENDHTFSPTEFLAELERKGIEPNRVTYQRLIAGYCQKGNIEGATQILEFMREKQMPISEAVFNALILGHSKAGDLQSARGILSVMGQASLEPSGDTYAALLCGYAAAGDLESLNAVFEECAVKDIFIADRDYLEIVFSLAINNHDDLVDTVLGKINRNFGYNQDASNVVLRLTTHGKEETALKILQTMQSSVRHDGQVAPSGGFFIRQLVKSNRPVKSILNICNYLKENGLNSRGLLIATEVALQSGNTNLALDLFRAMRDNLYPIRNHFFWPLLVAKGNESEAALLSVLKEMSAFKVSPNQETLRDFVLPVLAPKDNISNVDKLMQNLLSSGISSGAAAASLVGYLILKRNLQQAAEIASTYHANYNAAISVRNLVTAFLDSNDCDSFAKLTNALVQGRSNQKANEEEEEDVGFDNREFVGRILLSTVNTKRISNLTELLEKMVSYGLGISNSTAEQIQSHLSGAELTTEVTDLLSQLVSPDLAPVPLQRKSTGRFVPRNEESLKAWIGNLNEKGDPALPQKRQLFTLLCQNKDLDGVLNYCKKLEQENFTFTSGMHAILIELYLFHNKLDSALQEYNVLLQKEPDTKLDNTKTVKLATGLVQADRIDEAIDLLKKQARETNAFEVEKEKERPFVYNSACWRLLNTVAEKGDTEAVRKLFDVLIENKFIEANNVLLGPLIKAHLVKDDLKGALEVFEWCCQHYRATPFKNELACKLIQKEDAVELQRLTDLSTVVHGEINSLHDLIISFVECGRIRQARKILETPGLRVRTDRLSYAGERYKNEGLVEPLEALLKATKDISQVDRSALYFQLLMSYIKTADTTKALGLWTQMQEEDVQASEQFLYELGNFLKTNNVEVPFNIPNEPSNTQKFTEEISSDARRFLHRAISNKSWKELQHCCQRLEKNHERFYPAEVSSIIDIGIQADGGVRSLLHLVKGWLRKGTVIPRGKLYFFMKQLAKSGDVKAFEEMEQYLTDEQKYQTKFKNLLCNCYIEGGKVEELLTILEKKVENVTPSDDSDNFAKTWPQGGILGILSASPELLPRVEQLAERLAEKGNVSVINIVWLHHIAVNDVKKADELFNKYLKSSPRIVFRYIQQLSKKANDDQMAERLLEYLRKWDSVRTRQLGIAHSTKIDIYVKRNEPEKALAYLNEILREVTIEDINYTALNRLKSSLATKSIEFPYVINKHSRPALDDDSSDSDAEALTSKKSLS